MKKIAIFIFFLIVFFGLRTFNLEKRINFSMDQGVFMERAWEVWKEKEITLIGPTLSPEVYGRRFFQGPIIVYILAIGGVVTNWSINGLTMMMILFNLIGGIFIFKTIEILTGNKITAWIGLAWWVIWPPIVEFSNFIWNPNFLLTISPIFLYCAAKMLKSKKQFWSMFMGIVGGIGLQFHLVFGVMVIIGMMIILIKNKNLLIGYFLGIGIGYSPLLLFDLRNNFYNLKTIGEWILFGAKNREGYSYDWLSVWPVLIIWWSIKLKPKINYWLLGIVFVYSVTIVITTKQSRWMTKDWDVIKLNRTADIIKKENDGKFNVVNLLDGDTRFYALRFLLKDNNIETVENYKDIDNLWVVGRNDETVVTNDNLYEMSEIGTKKLLKKYELGDGIFLYRYKKENIGNLRVATIVNPIRGRSLWKDQSLRPIDDQYKIINNLGLKATWLVQNDVNDDETLVNRLKQFDQNQELGLFLEVSEKLAMRARVYYPTQTYWYNPKAVFLSGYDPSSRKKLIDTMITDFEKTFGYLPKSAGAWWIDSWSQQYLKEKYKIKTFLIVADQRTTDGYGIWGQWWGVPYRPSRNNILAPGKDDSVIIQWAQRDLLKAYNGLGYKTSNHSLQANDYTSLGLTTKYFEDLASEYLGVEKLGQITVGLETGIESVGNEKEYANQLKWIKDSGVETVKMSDFEQIYSRVYGKENPTKISLGNWILTPKYRENILLGDRVDYFESMKFSDYFQKDNQDFLNRIYIKENLIEPKKNYRMLITIGLVILIFLLRINLVWLVLGGIGLFLVEHLRYSVVYGEKMIGFLLDNFRFVGVSDKFRFINQDLSNVIAQSMLKIDIKENYYLFLIVVIIIMNVVIRKLKR